MSSTPDRWGKGAIYESYVGRWSRMVAREFLGWLDLPEALRWLDVGCGTGALTETILTLADPAEVKGVDASEGFIAHARAHIPDARASFEVGDAQQLPVESRQYDAVVAGLSLNFIPDQPKALAEMGRAAKSGGVVAAYVWDYAEKMQMMRVFWDAVTVLHPNATVQEEGRRFPMCRPEPLAGLFEGAGFRQVEVHSIDIPTVFRNFDDYWTPFLGGQGTAPTYVSSLSEQERTALGDYIQAQLPVNGDGTIPLMARAWAVRGTV